MANLTQNRLLDLSVIDQIKYQGSRNGVAEYTRRNLRTIGRQYNRYLKAKGQRVCVASVKGFLKDLQSQQAAPTWNLSRQNLKKVIKQQPGIIDNYLKRVMIDEIFSDIKPLQPDKKITNYLSYSEVLKLMVGSSPKTGLVIEFLFKTGCRISEMINIRLMDMRVVQQVSIKLIGKGSKTRTVFIDEGLYQRIRTEFQGLFYLFEHNGMKLDRFRLYRQIKKSGQKVLSRSIHPHLLRHSTANYLLKDCGKSPKYVAEFLGHSDPAITQAMYIHERPGIEMVDMFKTNQTKKEKTA